MKTNIQVVNFTPRSLSGLDAWYKADNVTLNGLTVSTWNDSSETGNSASQGTASAQPTLVNFVLNGNPVLRFDGVNDVLTISRPFSGSTQSIFAVAKNNDLINGSAIVGNSSLNRYLVISSALDFIRASHFDPNYAHSPIGVGTGFNTMSYIQNGTLGTCYKNGAAGIPNNSMETGDSSTINLIGQLGLASHDMDGDIAEIIYFNRALSDLERIAVESYLNSKYRIY